MVEVTGNDLAFVRGTLGLLADAGVATWVFGGWAEELLGLADPRPHHDLDLLYPAAEFGRVDVVIAAEPGLVEVTAKRLPHKRAFLRAGVLTELILAQPGRRLSYFTNFWDRFRYEWPADVLTGQAAGLRVASRAALQRYRADHGEIHAHRP